MSSSLIEGIDISAPIYFNPNFLLTPFPLYDGKEGISSETEVFQYVHLSLFGLITLFEESSTFPIGAFYYDCAEEQTTVEAGTFSVYKVSNDGGGNQYLTKYAPAVGNSVYQAVVMYHASTGKLYIDFHLELKSTNYHSP